MLNNPQLCRHGYLTLWVSCCFLIGIALFMQYQIGFTPCPLCMVQRVFVIAIGCIAFIAWLHQCKNNKALIFRIYPIIGMLFSVIGAGFSGRHIWLQSLSEVTTSTCRPSLSYLLEVVPFLEILKILLEGDANCSTLVWSFLGLSIPGWTLVAFVGLFILNGFILRILLRK